MELLRNMPSEMDEDEMKGKPMFIKADEMRPWQSFLASYACVGIGPNNHEEATQRISDLYVYVRHILETSGNDIRILNEIFTREAIQRSSEDRWDQENNRAIKVRHAQLDDLLDGDSDYIFQNQKDTVHIPTGILKVRGAVLGYIDTDSVSLGTVGRRGTTQAVMDTDEKEDKQEDETGNKKSTAKKRKKSAALEGAKEGSLINYHYSAEELSRSAVRRGGEKARQKSGSGTNVNSSEAHPS